MKARTNKFVSKLMLAIRQHPMEVLLAVFFSCMGCLYFAYKWKNLEGLLWYSPVCFLATYTLGGLFPEGEKRVVYYLSVFICLLFLQVEVEMPSVTWGVSLVVIQLLYLISFWTQDNEAFMTRFLCYIRSGISAGALTCVAWVLSISIYYSVRYIFEIWGGTEERFLSNVASIAGLGVFPLLFLVFNEDRRFDKGIRVFDMLANYVLSPALLIYAAILYLYFIKITVLWSLPKGGIAYIVVSFSAAVFLLKGCQVFLRAQYYNWFYKWSGLVVLPALIMYWVGSCYRINEYGFTEARVYLVVAGLILSCVALMFLTERTGRFLYAALLSVVFLSTVTYIPGIRAQDIERWSQEDRPQKAEESVWSDLVADYIDIENNGVVDIAGYRTMLRVENYRQKDGMVLYTNADSLFIDTEGKEHIYSESLKNVLEKQFYQAGLTGLTGNDTIPQSAYANLLRLELPEGTLILDRMSMRKDSVYTILSMGRGLYLER